MKNIKQKSRLSLQRAMAVASAVRSSGLPDDLEEGISLRDAVDLLQKGCNRHPELLTLSAALEIVRAAFRKEKDSELEEDREPYVGLQDAPTHEVNRLHRDFNPGHA